MHSAQLRSRQLMGLLAALAPRAVSAETAISMPVAKAAASKVAAEVRWHSCVTATQCPAGSGWGVM